LHTREEHEALAVARARLEDKAGRKLYAQRQGVESAIAQAACALSLRRARYCGLAKTHLQNVATAAALDIDRLGAWFAGRPLAPTRISRFAALAA
jgi:transposase